MQFFRMQVWPDFRKQVTGITDEIYDNYNPRSSNMSDKTVSYLLPENIKKIIVSNSRLAARMRPMIEHYLEKKIKNKNKS